MYDSDNNGFLDKIELREVITGMLDLLGASQKAHNAAQLADEVIRELDKSKDGKISKGTVLFSILK